jgi:hypothetical protein
MLGSATFVTETSMITIICAAIIRANVSQLCRCPPVPS